MYLARMVLPTCRVQQSPSIHAIALEVFQMKVYWNWYESTQTRHESTECGCETTVGKKRPDGLDLSHELGLKCPFNASKEIFKIEISTRPFSNAFNR